MDTPKYCKFAFISLNKTLLESSAWNTLASKQIRVFIYLWSCLQWYKQKKKKAIPSNNGDIAVSTVKMREKLGISKQTCSKAIHKLIEVGLIRLTRVGENTKVILTGDIEQIDNVYTNETSNGLTYAVEKFKESELAGHITFRKGERSKLATAAAKLL